MKKAEIRAFLVKLAVSLLVIGALVLLIYLLLSHFGLTDITREQIQEYISGTGAIAPIVFILVSFMQVTLVPIPGAITILAGSFIFGPYLSFLYSYIGMMLGAMLAFVLGRVVGRPFAVWLAGSNEKLDYWLEKLGGREKPVLFLMFFFPFFPDDLLCSVAGIFKISYPEFFIMQLLTRATSIGGTLLFMSGEIIPFSGWGIPVLIIAFVLLAAGYILFAIYLNKRGRKKKQAWEQAKSATDDNTENISVS